MSEKLFLDLNHVKAEFTAWRARRVGRQAIPPALWTAAVTLLEHYPISVVCRELKLPHHRLSKFRGGNGKPGDAFLALTAQELVSHQPQHLNANQPCRLVIERSDGSRLSLALPLNWPHLESFCARFLKA